MDERIYNVSVAYFGVVSYLYMFGLAALLAFDPFSRGLHFAALAYSALGVCFSIYFMYLQIAFIQTFCIYSEEPMIVITIDKFGR